MSVLIQFLGAMLERESGSKLPASQPCSKFLDQARRKFGSSVMPVPMANSLKASPSLSMPFFRLNSTGEEDNHTLKSEEIPLKQPTLMKSFSNEFFSCSSHSTKSKALISSAPAINYSACPAFSSSNFTKPFSSSSMTPPIPWMAYSPAVVSTQPTKTSPTASIVSSQANMEMCKLKEKMCAPPRMSTICGSSEPSQLDVGNQLQCSPRMAYSPSKEENSHTAMNHESPPIKKTESRMRQNSDRQNSAKHLQFTMKMSSPRLQNQTENNSKTGNNACAPTTASAAVDVKVQITSPPCSVKSRRKKSRPSSKKRKRNHRKRDCGSVQANMSSSQEQISENVLSSHNSFNSTESPQSFTVTFLDLSSSHDSSIELANSSMLSDDEHYQQGLKERKFSFLIRSDLDTDSECEKVDDRSVPEKKPSMCSKLLAVLQSSDFDSSTSESEDDEDWDEEDTDSSDTATQDDLWQSFSNNGLVNLSFTCSVTSLKPTEKDKCMSEGPEESESEAMSEVLMAEEKADAVKRWHQSYSAVSTEPVTAEKVCFPSAKQELATVHEMVAWDFAYRSARKGPWEQMARDHSRFQDRIKKVEEDISHVFSQSHRANVYENQFKD